MKNIIREFRKILLSEVSENLTDAKTTDGLICQWEGKLAVGIDIFCVDQTGANPCPDGEYQFEDGTNVTVVAGKVTEIETKEAEVIEPEDIPEGDAVVPVVAESELALPVVSGNTDVASGDTKMPADMPMTMEELACKVKALEENLLALAESFSKQNFKSDVQASIIDENKIKENLQEIPKEFKTIKTAKQTELSNVFANMYKKRN